MTAAPTGGNRLWVPDGASCGQKRHGARCLTVATRYDLMNDLMSGGVHRLWKAALIDWIAPQPGQTLVDLAGGTGDISLRFLNAGGGDAIVCDINEAMLSAGRQRRDMAQVVTGYAGVPAMPKRCLLTVPARML